MDIKASLPILSDLLSSWGIDQEHLVLTGQYIYPLQGFDLPVRLGHHNIVVDKSVLPWKVDPLATEMYPPYGTKYGKEYQEFIKKTGYDFDLILATPEDFAKRKAQTTLYHLKNGNNIYIHTPLGELEEIRIILDQCTKQGWGTEKGKRLLGVLKDRITQLKDQPKLVTAHKKVYERYQDLLAEKSVETHSQSSVTGLPVSRGIARGTVKVIMTKDQFDKFEPDDILVTKATTAYYVPLIAQSAGIVTDEGGLLSHAAIVSREMRKPCIVGTENATQVFKDGDQVMIDAQTGVVKLLDK